MYYLFNISTSQLRLQVICTILSISANCFSQYTPQNKGAIPLIQLQNTNNVLNTSTYAVIIGISNYQDPAIPDLRFADRDAEAFASFLNTLNDAKIRKQNIKLLLNEKATTAQVYKELDWLVDVCKEGDMAIIYFSGHGDVESKYHNQPGFLLCWDSPPKSYIGGALNIREIAENIIPTLSIDKKVKVLLITDACRAGKLAGSSFNGAQATAQAMTNQFANETKILSCQPNEYSHEGEQWGGGRGVFSYHLIEGLSGLADQNQNLQITLSEVDRYLEDHVSADVLPSSQTPMIVGSKTEIIAAISNSRLLALQEQAKGEVNNFTATQFRTAYSDFISRLDSIHKNIFLNFEHTLEMRQLVEPVGHCANDYLQEMIKKPVFAPVIHFLKRTFAAVLQDEVQQAFNALLSDDPYETNNWMFNPAKYDQYPKYLEKSIELLDPGHFKIHSLLSKKLYFEAYLILKHRITKETNSIARDSFLLEVKKMLRKAMELEPLAPYLYHLMASLYINTVPAQTDSVLFYDHKAIEIAPTWLLPYLDIIMEFQVTQNDFNKGESYLLKAIALNPKSYLLQERLSWFKQWQGKLNESINISLQMIENKPELFNAYNTLAHTYWILGEHERSLQWARKAMQLNAKVPYLGGEIIYSYLNTRRTKNALDFADSILYNKQIFFELKAYTSWYLKETKNYKESIKLIDELEAAITHPSMFVLAKATKGIIYYKEDKKELAKKILLEALSIDPFKNPFYPIVYGWLAVLKSEEGMPIEADSLFQKAINSNSGNWMDDFISMEEVHYLYGKFLVEQGKYESAEEQFIKANYWRSQNGFKGWFGLACLVAKLNKNEEALDYLEKSLDHYFPVLDSIINEPLLAEIRNTNRFRELIQKHFPK